MIQLLFFICLTIIVLCFVLDYWDVLDTEIWLMLGAFCFFGLAFCGIGLVSLTIDVQNKDLLRDKIVLYETSNSEIESRVGVLVERYIDYEASTFKDLKMENLILAAEMYPELKANTLVQQEIDLYKENLKHINTLKEELIEENISRWWLYFGKATNESSRKGE